VAGYNGSGNACYICAPGHEHSAPHILHTVPAAVLGVVIATVFRTRELGRGTTLLITNLGFCNVYNVRPLVTGQSGLSKGFAVLCSITYILYGRPKNFFFYEIV
jgi:hypothetical protein